LGVLCGVSPFCSIIFLHFFEAVLSQRTWDVDTFIIVVCFFCCCSYSWKRIHSKRKVAIVFAEQTDVKEPKIRKGKVVIHEGTKVSL
jgi:Na+/melibiose symporter-like transporter